MSLASFQATGAAGNDSFSGIENIASGAGNDSLLGDGNANVFFGGLGNDSLSGDLGNDTLSGGAGNDSLEGGLGTDWLSYSDLTGATQAVTVSLASLRATGAAGNDSFSGFENIISGAGNDTLQGDDNANTLNGGLGNDTLSGGLGHDSLLGSTGTDWVSYAELSDATQAVTVNLTTRLVTGAAGNDTLSSFENIVSGAGNDSLAGDGIANTLTGEAGDDTVSGGLGSDSLAGGDGNDWVSYADLTSAAHAVTVSLSSLRATGTSGNDSLSGFENIIAGSGNDSLSGNENSNALNGGLGNDTLSGDIDNDTLSGGAGNDSLIGGEGSDNFVFNTSLGINNRDVIQNYTAMDDSILLDDAIFTAIGSPGTLSAGAFNTGSAATDTDDRIIYNASTGALLYDADGSGSGAAIQFATLTGVSGTITAAEFLII